VRGTTHADLCRKRLLGCPLIAYGVEAPLPMVDDRRLDSQELGHAARAEAGLQQLDDPPPGLLLGWMLSIGAEPEEQMLRSQGVSQALRSGRRLRPEHQRLVRRRSRERHLLGFLTTALQHVWREVMPSEHPANPTVVNRDVIAVPGNPGQLAFGEGVGDRRLHNVLLDVTRQALEESMHTPMVGSATSSLSQKFAP
jgi:hypothetical protein